MAVQRLLESELLQFELNQPQEHQRSMRSKNQKTLLKSIIKLRSNHQSGKQNPLPLFENNDFDGSTSFLDFSSPPLLSLPCLLYVFAFQIECYKNRYSILWFLSNLAHEPSPSPSRNNTFSRRISMCLNKKADLSHVFEHIKLMSQVPIHCYQIPNADS